MNQKRLFFASCLAIIATAMAFSIRADIIPALKLDFGLTDTEMGQAIGPGLWGFAITIALGGMLVDRLGMGTLMVFAFVGHILGTLLTIFSTSFGSLYFATLLIGLSNGTVEAVTNPLTATIYSNNKTRYLNMLHAWWPGGLILGGLLSYAITKIMALDAVATTLAVSSLGWKIKMALVLLPTLGYGYLFLGQKFPKTERVTSGVSTKEMWLQTLNPFFLVFVFLMIFTAGTELGPDQWVGSLLANLVGIQGVLLLVYTAGIMFVLRQFCAGALLKKFSPLGLLIYSSILSALGLYWISGSKTSLAVLGAATVFGLGKAFFWPTMVGVVSERVPKGGALVMGLMGAMGMFSAGWLAAPAIGSIQDHYAVASLSDTLKAEVVSNDGLDERKVLTVQDPALKAEIESAKRYSAEMTYRWLALVPAILTLIFGAIFAFFKLRGGYKPVELATNSTYKEPTRKAS